MFLGLLFRKMTLVHKTVEVTTVFSSSIELTSALQDINIYFDVFFRVQLAQTYVFFEFRTRQCLNFKVNFFCLQAPMGSYLNGCLIGNQELKTDLKSLNASKSKILMTRFYSKLLLFKEQTYSEPFREDSSKAAS